MRHRMGGQRGGGQFQGGWGLVELDDCRSLPFAAAGSMDRPEAIAGPDSGTVMRIWTREGASLEVTGGETFEVFGFTTRTSAWRVASSPQCQHRGPARDFSAFESWPGSRAKAPVRPRRNLGQPA